MTQARNQGGGEVPRKFLPPLEKWSEHNLNILGMVQKIWAPLGKLFAPPGVLSWLRAYDDVIREPPFLVLPRAPQP